MATPWYQQTAQQALETLTSSRDGLNSEDVTERQATYGLNKIDSGKRKSKIAIFAAQFKDVMIGILVAAAIISFVVGEHTDEYVIVGIILGNALIGYRSEENTSALQYIMRT